MFRSNNDYDDLRMSFFHHRLWLNIGCLVSSDERGLAFHSCILGSNPGDSMWFDYSHPNRTWYGISRFPYLSGVSSFGRDYALETECTRNALVPELVNSLWFILPVHCVCTNSAFYKKNFSLSVPANVIWADSLNRVHSRISAITRIFLLLSLEAPLELHMFVKGFRPV